MSFRKQMMIMLTLLVTTATALSAQKYGHLNLGNVVALMPETKLADDSLAAYQQGLIAKGETMAKAFQENYNNFVRDYQSGEITPAQLKKREESLTAERDSIVAYDAEIKQLVQQRREALLMPIFEKVQVVLDAVAKDNGYTLVFDSSVFNTLLFAQDQDDLMPLVKKALGIQE
jgi:outer membrane protein